MSATETAFVALCSNAETAFVALGSNLGDRARMLDGARRAISLLPATYLRAASVVEETEPLGGRSQPFFLNQMLRLETRLTPHALLARLLMLERAFGRRRDARWSDRTLDCDIVAYGQVVMADATLVLPHPGIPDRDFWQRGLAALADAA